MRKRSVPNTAGNNLETLSEEPVQKPLLSPKEKLRRKEMLDNFMA